MERNEFETNSNEEENPEFDLRELLLDLAEKGEIDKSPQFIKKASVKNLERVYEKYKAKQSKETNEMICDMLVAKTGDILETIGWVKSGQETARKLQKKKLFMRDFTNLMAHVTPWVPFIGFVEGGISLGEDVASHSVEKIFFDTKGKFAQEEDSSERSEKKTQE